MPAGKQQIIEQAKFTYSPLGKAFEKQTKTMKDPGEKQIEALTNLKLKEIESNKTKPNKYNDFFKARKSQKMIKRTTKKQ